MTQLIGALRATLRRWLGIDDDVTQVERVAQTMARLSANALETERRLQFYEEEVPAIRSANSRLMHARKNGITRPRIHLLDGDVS